jgi:hypothetical protein
MDHPAFYTTTAAVIPVVLLALTIQTSFLRTAEKLYSDEDQWQPAVILTAFVAAISVWLASAEAIALASLFSHQDSPLRRDLIAYPVVFGIAILVQQLLVPVLIRGVNAFHPSPQIRAVSVALLSFAVYILPVVAFVLFN